MTDRYMVNTSRNEPAIRTNIRTDAEKWAELIGGQVIDMEETR